MNVEEETEAARLRIEARWAEFEKAAGEGRLLEVIRDLPTVEEQIARVRALLRKLDEIGGIMEVPK